MPTKPKIERSATKRKQPATQPIKRSTKNPAKCSTNSMKCKQSKTNHSNLSKHESSVRKTAKAPPVKRKKICLNTTVPEESGFENPYKFVVDDHSFRFMGGPFEELAPNERRTRFIQQQFWNYFNDISEFENSMNTAHNEIMSIFHNRLDQPKSVIESMKCLVTHTVNLNHSWIYSCRFFNKHIRELINRYNAPAKVLRLYTKSLENTQKKFTILQEQQKQLHKVVHKIERGGFNAKQLNDFNHGLDNNNNEYTELFYPLYSDIDFRDLNGVSSPEDDVFLL